LNYINRVNIKELKNMRYKVILIESEEGVAASCPQLRGCHSQGSTVAEALANIKDAIKEWLEA
jgi:predicted RNase H-like HicB family nuclease